MDAVVIDFSNQKWVSVIGSTHGNFQEIPADSYSLSGCSFNVILPSNNRHVIDRSFGVIDFPITIVGSGLAGSGNLWKTNTNGLRPIESVIRNLLFKSNALNASYPCSDLYNEMNTFNEDETDPIDSCDRCTNYADQYGSVSSQFAGVFDSQLGNNYTRGSYPITINSNSATAFNITVNFRMRLGKYPPFVKSNDRKCGINLTPFKIFADFESSLNRLVAVDTTNNTNTLQTLTFTLAQPTLTLRVITLPDNLEMPRQITYPFHQITEFTTNDAATVASGATSTMHSQVLQLDTVPGRILVFARPSKNTVLSSVANSVSIPNWYGSIQDSGVNITWGNENNLFVSGSQDEYYNMSKECGYKFSLVDWIGEAGSASLLAGSVFAFSPERHLGLKPEQMVSMSGKVNFKVSLTIKNQSAASTLFDLCVVVIYDGLIIVNDGFATQTNIVVNSPNELVMSDKSYDELMGGLNFKGLFGRVWKGIKKAHDFAKENKLISKYYKTVAPMAQMLPVVGKVAGPAATAIGEFAEKVGYGDSGGILVGGRQMSREDMRERMARVRACRRM